MKNLLIIVIILAIMVVAFWPSIKPVIMPEKDKPKGNGGDTSKDRGGKVNKGLNDGLVGSVVPGPTVTNTVIAAVKTGDCPPALFIEPMECVNSQWVKPATVHQLQIV